MTLHNIPYAHPAWVEVDLQQFKNNIALIRDYVHQRKICIPIKANAYGHGLIPIASAAVEAGADYLAVSCLQEGVLLRQANIRCAILVLGPVYSNQIEYFLQHNLEITISSLAKAHYVAEIFHELKHPHPIKVHIEVETGMQRTGVRIENSEKIFDYIDQSSKFFKVQGVYTHLATADNKNDAFAYQQIETFATLTKKLKQRYPEAIFHMANSGGTYYYPESQLDMVRPGKLAFGYFQTQAALTKPIFSIKARASYFKVVQKGQGISYGHHYTTTEDTRIVTVPIGYGDGYRRALSNKGKVLIHGKLYPIVGTICMDQFMVDIGQDSVYVGDEVMLVGKQGDEEITLGQLATLCDTIPSEILVNFNDRLPHLYRDGDKHYWEFNTLKESTLN
jgi:alanine racemase